MFDGLIQVIFVGCLKSLFLLPVYTMDIRVCLLLLLFFSVAAPSAAVLAAYACFFRFQEVILPRASEETSYGAI